MEKLLLILALSFSVFSCKEANKPMEQEKPASVELSQEEMAAVKSYDLEVGCGKCTYQQEAKSCVGAVKIDKKVYKLQGIAHKHSRCEHGAEKATVKGFIKEGVFIATEIPKELQ